MTEVIVKYSGNISALGFQTEILSENYAILTIPESEIPMLNQFTEIEYYELPAILTLASSQALDAACISPVQSQHGYGLNGAGTLIAIIDSGIDYRHRDFLNPDGTSRILYIWDQTISGTPPAGFLHGAEFTQEQINQALTNHTQLPTADTIGHGTAVAGIAGGSETGVAPACSFIVVKLGERANSHFARTTEIMRAIKYVYEKAQVRNLPLAVNISYGTNSGAHDGNSLFESYIDAMAEKWKSVIAAASGNEGRAGHHFSYKLKQGETISIPFAVSTNLAHLPLTLWKNFTDDFALELFAPNGLPAGRKARIIYNQPTHYNQDNEILIMLDTPAQGIWTLKITGTKIVDGSFDVWLPTIEEVSDKTAFLNPSPNTTLTLPSTARNLITVGAYDSLTGAIATFSGRGYTRDNVYVKPDLVAPGVNIRSSRSGGGYSNFTGTSMAAPFVTGSAALMMEWGIVQGNDPFLYGQRIKAFLQKGANRRPELVYPNNIWGYGTLCLKNTMDLLGGL